MPITQAEIDSLRADNEKLRKIVARYDAERLDREAEQMAQRLEAARQKESEEAQRQAEEKRKLDVLNIPRPETFGQYSKLPFSIKTALLKAHGGESFVRELVVKTRAGVDWATWDKLKAEAEKKPEHV